MDDEAYGRLLPAHWKRDVEGAEGGPIDCSSKKELFERLCAGVLLDGGKRAYWLDPVPDVNEATGKAKVCRALSARAVSIAWGDNPDFWTWQPSGECPAGGSRFTEVAYLEKVWWFDIKGRVKVRLPPDTYTVSARLAFDDFSEGWDKYPVSVTCKREAAGPGGHFEPAATCGYLLEPRTDDSHSHEVFNLRQAEDSWLELELAKFSVHVQQGVDLHFRIAQLDLDHEKRGLFFDGLVIRPWPSSLADTVTTGPHQEVVRTALAAPSPAATEVCYPVENAKQGRKRGMAIVISMEKNDVDQGRQRSGGSVDRGKLQTLANTLSLRIDGNTFLDYTAQEVRDEMKYAAENSILEEDECFVCFVNAHGGTDESDGSYYFEDGNGDDRVFVLNDVVEPFRNCEKLRGKPKIFFISSCRGHVKLGSVNESGVKQQVPLRWSEGPEARGVEQHSDYLIVMATSELAKSVRYPEYGTNFVHMVSNALSNIANRKAKHLMGIVTDITRDLSELKVEISERDSLGDVKVRFVSQCPVTINTLRKSLYWRSELV